MEIGRVSPGKQHAAMLRCCRMLPRTQDLSWLRLVAVAAKRGQLFRGNAGDGDGGNEKCSLLFRYAGVRADKRQLRALRMTNMLGSPLKPCSITWIILDNLTSVVYSVCHVETTESGPWND